MKFGPFRILFLFILSCFQAGTQSEEAKQKENKLPAFYQSFDFTSEHQFTSGIEGPAVDKDGNIYVVNFQKQGTIGIVDMDGKASLFVELPEGSIGNGIRINSTGRLCIADYPQHNILVLDPLSKEIIVFANNPTMNQPNDLAINKSGILFASDPNWKDGTGNIWRIDTDRKMVLLEENMGTTNGIEVSPDEKTLYVNESVQRKVWAYDLSPSGSISNKRLFHQFSDFGMDGMRCDQAGNLYITRHGKGTVAILSPTGELIREVVLKGKKPSNIAFGGEDGTTCYVTLQDRGCLEAFRSEYVGRSWKMFTNHRE